ncbi:right-handed parallel beta-helix repeat-containing protein [Stygiolobus caldivivus]|uniref:Right handed beta helix domain-containing protein n=1 Tax=Stygiolobus caldivivus TaxID=2824673 RepID=A0A8D5U4I2_9CREN|nr:right-handed parallel beta-helix repeat-containing protein [Stygiolobus caldivivus]BCU68814.1 hypothetical protein KN1_01110 [Stygiolobus caldivivus]
MVTERTQYFTLIITLLLIISICPHLGLNAVILSEVGSKPKVIPPDLVIDHVKNVAFDNITTSCITIKDSRNITIEGSYIHNSQYFGISIINSSNVLIFNDTVVGNNYDGVNIQNSSNVFIQFNNISFNGHDGITVWEGSQNITISSNVLVGNQYGIFILGSNNVSVTRNQVINSTIYDVYLYDPAYVEVKDNVIIGGGAGVEVDYGDFIYVSDNVISHDQVGVYLGLGIYNMSLCYNNISFSKYFGLVIHYYPQPFLSKGNIFKSAPTIYFFQRPNSTNTVEKQSAPTIITSPHKKSVLVSPIAVAVLATAVSLTFLSLLKRRRKG